MSESSHLSGYFVGLCECQAATRFWDVSSEFRCGLYPLVDYDFRLSEGFLIGLAIRRASWEFRYFSDESVIIVVPVDNNFVAILILHWYLRVCTSG